MTTFPPDTTDPALAAAFPTRLPDPEELVYEYVQSATQEGLRSGVPALSYYADRDRDQPKVPVARGWPAYPGQVPAIGVAAGPETEDNQNEITQGGFVGRVSATDDDGEIIGFADYWAEPLYATVIVELIHENRDERDRLHNELRRLLFPLRTTLPARDLQIRRVRVDAEKTEQTAGPPVVEQPLVVYVSVFTVHVYYEMLEAREVIPVGDTIRDIVVDVRIGDSGPPVTETISGVDGGSPAFGPLDVIDGGDPAPDPGDGIDGGDEEE